MTDTILIVDDEEPIRRTFTEWLAGEATVVAVADAEAALAVANTQPIDLAILDWNLGTGSDGLRLLEDLVEFQPELVAILITGYAAQATPLEALRTGVRDYLDKNSDLTRETFLKAVRKQLNLLRPAKRQREFHAGLARFREAVEKVLPLVRGTATLNDSTSFTTAATAYVALASSTFATDAVLVVQHGGTLGAFNRGGAVPLPSVPFAETVAGSAVALNRPSVMSPLADVTLLPFEASRTSVMAVPLAVDGLVLEVFDKAFNDADRSLATLFAAVGNELFRGLISERQTHAMLADAVAAALKASEDATINLGSPPSEPPSAEILDTLKRGLDESIVDPDLGLDLVTAVRELAVRHGPPAVEHCVKVVRSLRTLLDQIA